METCANCELEWDVAEDVARAQAHHSQIHFPWMTWCPENLPRRPGSFAELYDRPWDQFGRFMWFCSEACEEAYCRSRSFDYSECDGCSRRVCEQNPSNGWMVQFRDHALRGHVCLRCYESEILTNGQPRSDFEGPTIQGGMFFSAGNKEPKARGYIEVAGFVEYYVPGFAAAERYNTAATELINAGNQVVTGYERLAIGGLEGYITMLAKRARLRRSG